MAITYSLEEQLNWNDCESIEINVEGWKPLSIEYIDNSPWLFWRLKTVKSNVFRSYVTDMLSFNIVDFFHSSLKEMKNVVLHSLDLMEKDRRDFYINNIIIYFDD